MNKYILILFAFIFTQYSCSVAQNTKDYPLTSNNKKALKYFYEAKEYYANHNDKLAELTFLQALEKDPNFIEPHIYLAYIYTDAGEYDKAIEQYKKVVEINPDFFPDAFGSMGLLLLHKGEYAEAKKAFEKALTYPNQPKMMLEMARKGLTDCNFALEAIKNPVPFEPKNMGENINSKYSEYFPTISADGNFFLFTRRLETPNGYNPYNEDFFVTEKMGGKWQRAHPLTAINTENNEGAPTLSANGRFLIYTLCAHPAYGYGKNKKGFGSCDLFYTYRVGDSWKFPRNLGQPINSNKWESQPSFSSDGKTLYFVRGIFTGRGIQNQDIYVSTLGSNGIWSKPEKLSPKINTPGREESVFIHPDGKTLYFSSDGHPGMGGLDIYMSRKDENGEWSEPVNLGYPINTHNDENSILVHPNGQLAYFASDREGGFGELDLYSFELPENVRPLPVTYMKGTVYDAKTKEPLNAKFELIDLETGKLTVTSFSDKQSGEFLVVLPANRRYALNVSKDGYLFYSENFELSNGTFDKPFLKDVPLHPIEVGEKVVLKNVFFETAKYDLKPESKIELDKLVAFLKKNSTLKLLISGHTDNVGNPKDNQILSENRAKAVYDYLVENGVDPSRLQTAGFGDTKPIADNNTEEGRALNRRTEIEIIAK
tara:strand:- start:40576 stop:42540 length:1965 start_codon:yes stop_codon:yes gene_type:complete